MKVQIACLISIFCGCFDSSNSCIAQCYFYNVHGYGPNDNYIIDGSWAIIETAEKDYVVAGLTDEITTGGGAAWRVNNCGELVWVKAWEFSNGVDDAYSVVELNDRSLVFLGLYRDTSGSLANSYLYKTSASGDSIWFKSIDAGISERPKSLIPTSDGGFVIGGYFNWYIPDAKIFLLKTDNLGNIEWQHNYGEDTTYNYLRSANKTPDGGYVLGGWVEYDYSPNVRNFFIIKTDSLGSKEWGQLYDGWYDGYTIPTRDGGYMIVGDEYLIPQDDYNGIMIKTDSAGNVEWERRLRAPNDPNVFGNVEQLPDGSYILGGGVRGAKGRPNVSIMKFSEGGSEIWRRTYTYYGGSNDDDYISDLIVTQQGDIVVTGYVIPGDTALKTGNDMFILKVDSAGNLVTSLEEVPRTKNDIKVYPNPNNGQMTLEYQLEDGNAFFKLFDVSGRMLDEKFLSKDIDKIEIKVTYLEAGLYFFKIESSKQNLFTDKIIIH